MSSKSSSNPKSGDKPAPKVRKGATETSRLFIDVDEFIRKPQISTSRYVE